MSDISKPCATEPGAGSATFSRREALKTAAVAGALLLTPMIPTGARAADGRLGIGRQVRRLRERDADPCHPQKRRGPNHHAHR